jgi:hypothetical protein
VAATRRDGTELESFAQQPLAGKAREIFGPGRMAGMVVCAARATDMAKQPIPHPTLLTAFHRGCVRTRAGQGSQGLSPDGSRRVERRWRMRLPGLRVYFNWFSARSRSDLHQQTFDVRHCAGHDDVCASRVQVYMVT